MSLLFSPIIQTDVEGVKHVLETSSDGERKEINSATIDHGSTPLIVASDVTVWMDVDPAESWYPHINEANKLKIVKLLCEHGADVHATNVREETALFCAAKEGYVSIAQYLIEQGADVNHVSSSPRWIRNTDLLPFGGYTPLTIAAAYGHDKMIDVLCTHGANLNHKLHCGSQTALELAKHLGYTKSVERLLNAGAKE